MMKYSGLFLLLLSFATLPSAQAIGITAEATVLEVVDGDTMRVQTHIWRNPTWK